MVFWTQRIKDNEHPHHTHTHLQNFWFITIIFILLSKDFKSIVCIWTRISPRYLSLTARKKLRNWRKGLQKRGVDDKYPSLLQGRSTEHSYCSASKAAKTRPTFFSIYIFWSRFHLPDLNVKNVVFFDWYQVNMFILIPRDITNRSMWTSWPSVFNDLKEKINLSHKYINAEFVF